MHKFKINPQIHDLSLNTDEELKANLGLSSAIWLSTSNQQWNLQEGLWKWPIENDNTSTSTYEETFPSIVHIERSKAW